MNSFQVSLLLKRWEDFVAKDWHEGHVLSQQTTASLVHMCTTWLCFIRYEGNRDIQLFLPKFRGDALKGTQCISLSVWVHNSSGKGCKNKVIWIKSWARIWPRSNYKADTSWDSTNYTIIFHWHRHKRMRIETDTLTVPPLCAPQKKKFFKKRVLMVSIMVGRASSFSSFLFVSFLSRCQV